MIVYANCPCGKCDFRVGPMIFFRKIEGELLEKFRVEAFQVFDEECSNILAGDYTPKDVQVKEPLAVQPDLEVLEKDMP